MLAAFWIAAITARNGNAEQLSLVLDPAKTKLAFTISDTLHAVHGTFRLKEGHLSFDPATNGMSGVIVVDASSGDSGSAARDRRMTRDILQAQQFPDIRFSPFKESGSVARLGTSDVNVTGTFLIHGKAHELTIPMHVEITAGDFVARGTFLIPYVEWGMKNPSNILIKVQDKVEIDLTASGHATSSNEKVQ